MKSAQEMHKDLEETRGQAWQKLLDGYEKEAPGMTPPQSTLDISKAAFDIGFSMGAKEALKVIVADMESTLK